MNAIAYRQELDAELAAKDDRLRSLLRDRLAGGLVIAFSGGVDSAFLLWSAEQERLSTGGRLLGLTTESASLASAERRDVDSFIKHHSIEHLWQQSREVADPKYAANDLTRCFHCKSELFRICREVANERQMHWIAYGYNASDRGDFRPGHQAALDNGILSPLAEADLAKDDIRRLMRFYGLEMADKPASPCLSSRLVTGVAITPKKLKDVDEIETILRDAGLKVFRVRVHEAGGARSLRLEVSPTEMDRAFELRDVVSAAAKDRGFKWATLDLEGYKTGGGNA